MRAALAGTTSRREALLRLAGISASISCSVNCSSGPSASAPTPTPLSLSPYAYFTADSLTPASTWTDLSGNGRHATKGTAPYTPLVVTGVHGGRSVVRTCTADNTTTRNPLYLASSGSTFYSLPSFGLGPNTTIWYLGRSGVWTGSGSIGGIVNVGPGGAFVAAPCGSGANWGSYLAGARPSSYDAWNWRSRTARFTNYNNVVFRTDGVEETNTTGTAWANGAAGLFGFADASLPHTGELMEVAIFNRILTPSECLVLDNYAAQYRRNFVMFHGNSLTAGNGTTNADLKQYAQQVRTLMNASFDGICRGLGGYTTPQLITDATTNCDPFICKALPGGNANAGNLTNIFVGWEGRNDVVVAGASGSTAYNNLVTYYNARKAAGWTVVAMTVLPSTSLSEADRTTINSGLRANSANYADALCDVASDTTIGQAGQNSNTTYYVDGVHCTDAGYGIVANYVKATLQTLMV